MDLFRAINSKLSWKTDAGMVQLLIYGIALVIMVVGIRKVATLELTEASLIFGILQVLILAMQVVIVGTVVGLCAKRSAKL
jgi:hypothetical protein